MADQEPTTIHQTTEMTENIFTKLKNGELPQLSETLHTSNVQDIETGKKMRPLCCSHFN